MSARQEGRRSAAPVALFLFAWLIRALPFGRVFDDDRTVFAGNDAWYHMHRVRDSLAPGNWPALIDFDPMLNWPHGARPIWTPLFDAFVSASVLPFHAIGGIAAAEIAAAWIPPILGALGVVVLYFTARELTDETTARIAGALLAVLFGHTWYSQVGFLDHHVAVALFEALLLLVSVQFARSPDLSGSILISACEAAAILLWPGALMDVALVELGLGLGLARRPAADSSRAYGQRAAGHTIALVGIAPFCVGQEWPQWTDYSATVLSLFQPMLFAALAVHAALLTRLLRSEFASSTTRRVGCILGGGIAVLLACLVLIPDLRESAIEAWSWLARDEAFQANVAESEPLLIRRGDFTLGEASLRLSWFFPLLPLMWGAFVRKAWRESGIEDDPGQGRSLGLLVFGTWALGIVLAALAQKRFAHSASLATALLVAWSLRALLPSLARLTSYRLASLSLAALTLLCTAPSLRLHADTLRASLQGELTNPNHGRRRLLAAGDWLRENAGDPPTGVLAPWHLGHPLLYASQLPMVVGNFGDDVGADNFKLAHEYFRSLEERAVRLLDNVETRFVVIESLSAKDRDQFGPRTMYRRLAMPVLRDLGQHRLRYASPADERPLGATSYRVFERVTGALIEGEAPPGTVVTARIQIGPIGASIGSAVVSSEADVEGRYAMRLAQAGGDGATGTWQISTDTATAALAISETALRDGATLVGPNFNPADN